MTEKAKGRPSLDPTELWKQWYETSSKAWSAALENNKEGFVDPYGLYTSWLKRMGSAQEEMRQGDYKSWPRHHRNVEASCRGWWRPTGHDRSLAGDDGRDTR